MAETEMIRYFVFDSIELKNHAFTKEEFDEIDDESLIALKLIQNSLTEKNW